MRELQAVAWHARQGEARAAHQQHMSACHVRAARHVHRQQHIAAANGAGAVAGGLDEIQLQEGNKAGSSGRVSAGQGPASGGREGGSGEGCEVQVQGAAGHLWP